MFDLPTSKPRISPSAKSAGPSRIRIRLISTFAVFRGAPELTPKTAGRARKGGCRTDWVKKEATKLYMLFPDESYRSSGRGPRPSRHFVAPSAEGRERVSLPSL